ncbi:MAG TPA: hypothetical protein VN519_08315 [Bryobacteraceae bacterium]|nr:hypothetical protein [Bryobacteraceae bacterium]
MGTFDWDRLAALAEMAPPESVEALADYRGELEALLKVARAERRKLGTALARVRAANDFTRQGFGALPGF